MSPAAFRRHIDHLLSTGVAVTTVEDLLASGRDRRDAVALTFDDAYTSFAEQALPVLANYGLTATLFVPPALVGKTNEWVRTDRVTAPELPILDWDAIGAAMLQGIAIGSHTRRHPALTRLTPGRLADEIGGASRDIESRLGVVPAGLAYPYGLVSGPVTRAAAEVHRWACTTDFRELADDAVHELPRLDMWYFEQPGLFERWGTPSFRRWVRWRNRLRHARAAGERLLAR